MGKNAKLTAPLTALSDLATLMPLDAAAPEAAAPEAAAPEVTLPETPEAAAPEVAPAVQPTREQDETKFNEEFQACLNELADLGATKAAGDEALTDAGIKCTRWVYERKMNESHVETAYRAFSTGHREAALAGDELPVDKSAKSRFLTFFKPEVAAFVHGRADCNFNWHTNVKAIRAQRGAGNCVSLYNALLTFNREVVKAKLAAPQVITAEFIGDKILKSVADPKTLEAKLLALKKSADSLFKASGAPEMDKRVVDAIGDYIEALKGTGLLEQLVITGE